MQYVVEFKNYFKIEQGEICSHICKHIPISFTDKNTHILNKSDKKVYFLISSAMLNVDK